jgi:hypothetical protein
MVHVGTLVQVAMRLNQTAVVAGDAAVVDVVGDLCIRSFGGVFI